MTNQVAEKWLPLSVDEFFTPARAYGDMWFGDELPPTLQDDMASPLVTQAKAMLAYQLLQQLAMEERRQVMVTQQRRLSAAKARIHKGRKPRR